MPKILEKGTANMSIIYGICICDGKGHGDRGCGTKLEVYIDDLFQTSHTDYGGDTTQYANYECPVCGATNVVNYEKINYLPTKEELPLFNAKNECLTKLQDLCGDDIKKWQAMFQHLDRIPKNKFWPMVTRITTD